MGFVFSRLRKKSRSEQLNELYQESEGLKLDLGRSLSREKCFFRSLAVFFLICLVVGILYCWFGPKSSSWLETVLRWTCFGLLIAIFLIITRMSNCYCISRRNKSKMKLRELNQKKKALWKVIQESEPYNKVKELMEKYGLRVSQKGKKNDCKEAANMA